jgi:hypothetical protein
MFGMGIRYAQVIYREHAMEWCHEYGELQKLWLVSRAHGVSQVGSDVGALTQVQLTKRKMTPTYSGAWDVCTERKRRKMLVWSFAPWKGELQYLPEPSYRSRRRARVCAHGGSLWHCLRNLARQGPLDLIPAQHQLTYPVTFKTAAWRLYPDALAELVRWPGRLL